MAKVTKSCGCVVERKELINKVKNSKVTGYADNTISLCSACQAQKVADQVKSQEDKDQMAANILIDEKAKSTAKAALVSEGKLTVE